MFVNKMWVQLIYLTFLLSLSACIGIPIPKSGPGDLYDNAGIKSILEHSINRNEVLDMFGVPDSVHKNDNYWIYRKRKSNAHFYGFWLIPGVTGALPAIDSPMIYSSQILLIEFNQNDEVVAIDLIEDDEGCRDDGVCLYGPKSKPVLTTKTNLEYQAKQYKINEARCGVYIQSEIDEIFEKYVEVLIAIEPYQGGYINNNAFAYYSLTPGEQSLIIINRHINEQKYINCEKGKNLYFLIEYDEKWMSIEKGKGKLLQLTEMEFIKKAKNKRLVMDAGNKILNEKSQNVFVRHNFILNGFLSKEDHLSCLPISSSLGKQVEMDYSSEIDLKNFMRSCLSIERQGGGDQFSFSLSDAREFYYEKQAYSWAYQCYYNAFKINPTQINRQIYLQLALIAESTTSGCQNLKAAKYWHQKYQEK